MIALSSLASVFNTDRTFIDDAILLMQNVVADIREATNGMIVSDAGNALQVSYQAYKWAIGFNVLITCEEQIERMRAAIKFNVETLQPNIEEYEQALNDLNKLTFFGSEKIKRSYHKKMESGAIPESTTFEDFESETKAPLLKIYSQAKDKIYLGEYSLHPNEYLQSLGLKQIRFSSISPLFL